MIYRKSNVNFVRDQQGQQVAESQQDTLLELYQQWLNHPTTRLLIKAIEKHKKSAIDMLCARASDTTMTDAAFRQQSHILKTSDAILKIITNYEVFKKQLETE